MKIHLHSNLPYKPDLPNVAIGYLNGFLKNNDIDCENFYWNLLPPRLHSKIIEIDQKVNEIIPYNEFLQTTIAMLASYLYGKNHSCIYENAIDINIKSIADRLSQYYVDEIKKHKLHEADLACFTIKCNQWILNYYIMKILKKLNPSISILAGGFSKKSSSISFAKNAPEIDYFIWGEGEIPLLNLIKNIKDGKSLSNIPNLIYRNDDGLKINDLKNKNSMIDIKEYPFANHDKYFKKFNKYKPPIKPGIPIISSRSCPWKKCKFCSMNENMPYRERKIKNVISEIEYQSNKYDVRRFIFVDTDIGRMGKEEFDSFLNKLIDSSKEYGEPYNFIAELSPTRINRKNIKKMKKISFAEVQVGFEALCEDLLNKMEKKQSLIHNINVLKICKEQDFNVDGLNIIKDIPGEKKEDIKKSVENLKFIRFFINDGIDLYPIKFRMEKGAPFYSELDGNENKWRMNKKYDILNDLDIVKDTNRWDLFGGFYRNSEKHLYYWDLFKQKFDEIQSSNYRYKWFIYANNGSIVKEFKNDKLYRKYHLELFETKLMKFCDSIKSFEEIKNEFQEIDEKEIRKISQELKNVGLMFIDESNRYLSLLSKCKSYNIE